MEIVRGERGQAALTDSLYFLMIVSGLSALLFYFTANYGLLVEQQVVRQYRTEYAQSALQTILYTSAAREPGVELDSAREIDYLLAAVKEDYADDQNLDETGAVLVQNVTAMMTPFSPAYDYLFYIYVIDKRDFVIVLMHGRKPGTTTKEKITMLCSPGTMDDVDSLLATLGETAQSTSRIQLIDSSALEGNRERESRLPSQISLVMWVPTELGEEQLGKLACQEITA